MKGDLSAALVSVENGARLSLSWRDLLRNHDTRVQTGVGLHVGARLNVGALWRDNGTLRIASLTATVRRVSVRVGATTAGVAESAAAACYRCD